MRPFAEVIDRQIDELARCKGGPVRTRTLAELLGVTQRTVQRYAAALEAAGRVTRPSPRGGWLPARMAV